MYKAEVNLQSILQVAYGNMNLHIGMVRESYICIRGADVEIKGKSVEVDVCLPKI